MTRYDAIVADHIAACIANADDADLFDGATPDEILGDRAEWSGFGGRSDLTDREWAALQRAADRYVASL